MEDPRLKEITVLVLEDEPLVALDVVDGLSAAGADVRTASTIENALLLVDEICPSTAILDINIAGQDCASVCQRLSERAIPFAFYTGCAMARTLDAWPDAPVIRKPTTTREVVEVVVQLCRARSNAGYPPGGHPKLAAYRQ